jgi:hypothetical protein
VAQKAKFLYTLTKSLGDEVVQMSIRFVVLIDNGLDPLKIAQSSECLEDGVV